MKTDKKRYFISLFLAFLVMGTSMSFSIDLHFCSGHLKNISLFGEAESCHDEKTVCPMHGVVMQMQKKDCCENEKVIIQDLDEDYVSSNINFGETSSSPFVVISIPSNSNSEEKFFLNDYKFKNYRPPIPKKDIPVLIQSFLL